MSFLKPGMNPVNIANETLQGILHSISNTVQSIDLDKLRNIPREENAEDWLNKDYLDHIVWKGREHDGYPEMLRGVDIQVGKFEYNDASEKIRILEEIENSVSALCSWSGARNRALSAIYPPGGFIGWHNNANAPGYNIIFTWSETGDGQWEHIDPLTKEHIIIPDVQGWQCKYGYYGTYDEPDKLLYHAARTNSLRCTMAFMFNCDETGRKMSEMLIEEIETP
jgi:hypothetical protein